MRNWLFLINWRTIALQMIVRYDIIVKTELGLHEKKVEKKFWKKIFWNKNTDKKTQ